ncbi:MAG: hypothetical protein Q8L55_06575 [Phycisphaerales bacterium]|nr:hypothetical protein [Phycisphaerales bacterium]
MMPAIVAMFIAACGAAGQIGTAQPKPEPTVELSAARVFTDAREAARSAPIAERLTVTVKQPEHTPLSAALVLRIAPGKQRDGADTLVSIDAGDLRIHARGGTKDEPGELIAVSVSNPTAYYRTALDGPPTAAAISAALLPLPLPTLAVYFAVEGQALAEPTPLTGNIAWSAVSLPINDLRPPITLTGTIDGKPGASILFEYQQDRLRLRSFSSPLVRGRDARVLQVTAAWIEPGDPKSWLIDVSGRTRVESIAALGTRVEPPSPPPAPTPEPEKKPADEPVAEPPKVETPSTAAPPPKRGPEP